MQRIRGRTETAGSIENPSFVERLSSSQPSCPTAALAYPSLELFLISTQPTKIHHLER